MNLHSTLSSLIDTGVSENMKAKKHEMVFDYYDQWGKKFFAKVKKAEADPTLAKKIQRLVGQVFVEQTI